ncbi:MAG: ACT domain-containing protein [Planctomycetes bacterium]|nr:ACT domain-containing protein [Planctomycetota bacterium]
MDARLVDQISIFIENRPGILAEIATSMAAAGVNLRAISVSESIDHAVVRMVTSDVDKAKKALAEAGVISLENEVIEIALDDRPGALAELTQKLAAAGINLEYAYGSSPADSSLGLIIIRVDDTAQTLKISAGL